MRHFYEDVNDSDSGVDENADPDDEYYDELKENRQLHYVSLFKIDLRKSPTFIGLDNISSYDVLKFIKSKKEINKKSLDSDEILLFDDLYFTLFGIIGTKKQYEYVSDQIFLKVYV